MTARLVLGPRHLLDDTQAPGPTDVVTVVRVPDGAATPTTVAGTAANTVLLRLDHAAEVEARTAPAGAMDATSGRLVWSGLVDRLLPGRALNEHRRGVPGGEVPATPVLLVADAPAAPGVDAGVHVWTRVRVDDTRALLVRVTPEPTARPDGAWWPLLETAARLHRAHSLFLNNHQCYYRRLFPGEEIEHKYVLDVGTDVWAATVQLYNALRDGSLPGFVPEHGDEFQGWDYLNHLFEVPGPPQEQGYVSFIPLSTGGYTIKRKWFREDATRRGERHLRESGEIPDFTAYARDRFGVDVVALPPFRRVRYDINLESLRTGHLYGVFFDHSRLVDAPDVAMVQCELEYIRSRTVRPCDEQEVLDELDVVARWLEAQLTAAGLDARRGVYSKLSFLRDSVRSRPDLAEVP
ncbi:hypothetical protein [Cellulomonas bogoriensis]